MVGNRGRLPHYYYTLSGFLESDDPVTWNDIMRRIGYVTEAGGIDWSRANKTLETKLRKAMKALGYKRVQRKEGGVWRGAFVKEAIARLKEREEERDGQACNS